MRLQEIRQGEKEGGRVKGKGKERVPQTSPILTQGCVRRRTNEEEGEGENTSPSPSQTPPPSFIHCQVRVPLRRGRQQEVPTQLIPQMMLQLILMTDYTAINCATCKSDYINIHYVIS